MNGMAICAGVEGIELGLRLVEPEYRTVCYVEGELYTAAILRTRMEEALLDEAPIWDDVKTFNGKSWRGKVDIITAGFPCQPWSVAGKQEGTKDERWIWPDIARIIGEVRPGYVFLENVQASLIKGEATLSLETLPKLGIILNGCLYRLPMSERITKGRGSGYWPTPSAQPPGWKHIEVVDKDGKPPQHPNQRFYHKKTGRVVQKGLEQVVKMWKSPVCADSVNREMYVNSRGEPNLAGQVKLYPKGIIPQTRVQKQDVKKWPTPRVSDTEGGRIETEEINGVFRSKRKKSNQYFGAKLRDAAELKDGGQLNPTWVEWLMGFPSGWTGLEPVGMESFHSWQQQHLESLKGGR